MKNNLLCFIALLIVLTPAVSCKCKRASSKGSDAASGTSAAVLPDKTLTTGKVSHQYIKEGCGTVVIVEKPGSGSPMVLIPSTPLKELDVDGIEITFHYLPLKMKNPAGCNTGNPAALSDVSKK